MTIKITAQDLNSEQSLQVIRLCNTIILQNGNYGNYTVKYKIFNGVFHLKELTSEISQIMTLIENNITEFTCTPNEVEVNETFGILLDANITSEVDTYVEPESGVEEITPEPQIAIPRKSRRWTFKEEKDLVGYYQAGMTINQLARLFNKEEDMVKEKLAQKGILL